MNLSQAPKSKRNLSMTGGRSSEDLDVYAVESKLQAYEARMKQAVENRAQRQKKVPIGLESSVYKSQSYLKTKAEREQSDYFSSFEKNVLKRAEIAKRAKLLNEERQARSYYDIEERRAKQEQIQTRLAERKQEKSKQEALLMKKNLLRKQETSKG